MTHNFLQLVHTSANLLDVIHLLLCCMFHSHFCMTVPANMFILLSVLETELWVATGHV